MINFQLYTLTLFTLKKYFAEAPMHLCGSISSILFNHFLGFGFKSVFLISDFSIVYDLNPGPPIIMNLFKISVPQLKAYKIIGQFHHSIIHSKSICPYFLTYKMKLTPTERATVRIK